MRVDGVEVLRPVTVVTAITVWCAVSMIYRRLGGGSLLVTTGVIQIASKPRPEM
jgi:hypothetical protein